MPLSNTENSNSTIFSISDIFFIFILISSYKLQKYYKINNYFKKYLNDNIEHRKSFEIQIKELIEKFKNLKK